MDYGQKRKSEKHGQQSQAHKAYTAEEKQTKKRRGLAQRTP